MGNLIEQYPDAFMEIWEGCSHIDCLPGCRLGLEDGHCERFEIAFNEYRASSISRPTQNSEAK